MIVRFPSAPLRVGVTRRTGGFVCIRRHDDETAVELFLSIIRSDPGPRARARVMSKTEVRARQPPGQHVAWALGLGAHDRHERRRADSGIARRAPAAGAGESARRARPRGRRMGPGPQRPHPIHEETGERRAGRRPRAAATKTVRRAPPFSATAGAKRKPITVCRVTVVIDIVSRFRAHLHSDAGSGRDPVRWNGSRGRTVGVSVVRETVRRSRTGPGRP